MSRWVVMLAVGCGGGPGVAVPPVSVPPEATIPLTNDAIGPLTAATRSNLVVLRRVLHDYDVVPVNIDNTEVQITGEAPDEPFPTLEFQVFDGDQRLFAIVPDDQGNILNVHVESPKVTVSGHPWRVGAAFVGSVTTCECWGGRHPVCFNTGEHVAVSFARGCRGLDDGQGRRSLVGKPILKLVWSPKPFGEAGETDEAGGE